MGTVTQWLPIGWSEPEDPRKKKLLAQGPSKANEERKQNWREETNVGQLACLPSSSVRYVVW